MSTSDNTFGPCTIERNLGGDVWLGTHSRLDRNVVIRILPADRFEKKGEAKRFLEEALQASRLKHPGIVKIHDVGDQDGRPYVIMEHMSGRNVEYLIHQKGILTVSQAIVIVKQAAQALGSAHRKKIAHLNLRPSSIHVSRDREVKLVDFGQWRAATPESVARFAAPDRKKDERSDIYSLGAIFYHLITGEHVTEGRTHTAHEVHAGISPEMSDLIKRMIDAKRAKRLDTMEDVILALQRFGSGMGTQAKKSKNVTPIAPPDDMATLLELDIPDGLDS